MARALNEEQVEDIVQLYAHKAKNRTTMLKLADKYGVSRPTITKVIRENQTRIDEIRGDVKVRTEIDILDKEHRLKLLTDIIRDAEKNNDIDTLLKAIQTLDKIDDRKNVVEKGKQQVIISLPDNERNERNKNNSEDA